VHERDLDTDFLLTVLRELMGRGELTNLRIILMSATLDANLFSRYFGGAPGVHIPGFMHPVQVSKWSCLSTAGGTSPPGYSAGRVVTPASPGRRPREGEARA
jgi:hypothetical protein